MNPERMTKAELIARLRELEERAEAGADNDPIGREHRLLVLSRTVEQSPSSVVITDTSGAIQYVNPTFTRITGYTLDEVRGRNPSLLKSGETPQETYQELWRALRSGRDWQGVFCNRKKNGGLYWESAIISPIKDETGAVIHYLAIKEDITGQRRLAQEMLNAIENEQRRFGRDLHDDLCQQLAGLQLLSGLLAKTLARQGRPEAADAANIAERIREAMERARMLARGLSTIALESSDLSGALAELAANAGRLFQIRCEYHGDGPLAIDDAGAATHLYRIVQEAISNAARHGRAKHVIVSYHLTPRRCRLEIRDDGRGFSPGRIAPAGMGLDVMRYRAAMIGGKLEIKSAPGRGARLVCTIPKRLVGRHAPGPQ